MVSQSTFEPEFFYKVHRKACSKGFQIIRLSLTVLGSVVLKSYAKIFAPASDCPGMSGNETR